MNKYFLVVILFFILSCSNSKRDFVTVSFKAIENCKENGIPRDSSIVYYPIDLFSDTIPGFFNGYGIIPSADISKEKYAKSLSVDLSTLRDSFYIEKKGARFLEFTSYMYFKMNESVLYSHYLGKDIYRLTSIRSNYKSPLVVTIENSGDSIVLITKELDRRIGYPLIKDVSHVVFIAPDFSMSEKDRKAKQKRINDSIAYAYRNSNYHLVINKRIRISKAIWDSLEILVDSAKFWESKSILDLSRVEDDDSRMIIEGHKKEGYQIRVMPSLHLYRRPNVNAHCDNYDPNNNNTKIIRYLMMHTGLTDSEIY